MATARPKAGEVEERTAPELVAADGPRLRGRIPYGTESRDLGGFTEIVEKGALANTKFDDLVVTVDHVGVPLGRFPGTLELEDRDDGLHWSVDPPAARADIREAVERGDLRAGSWRMQVGRDEWRGNTRHIHEIAVLKDVAIATRPAYEGAVVEYRSQPAEGQEEPMSENAQPATEPAQQDQTEDRAAPAAPAAGTLHVKERRDETAVFTSLADAFRSRGFPHEVASISSDEFRAVTWGGTIDALNQQQILGGPFGADERYAWQAVRGAAVEAGVTSIQVTQQTARSLAAGTVTIRPIDATSNKPEVGSTLNIVTVPMKQVAGVQTGVPNVHLEQPVVETVIEQDLRLSVYDGLDELVRAAIASSGNQAPGSDNLLVSIRKAITTLRASGYPPNLIILTPAASETLDTLVSGISGGTADFVFGAAQFAPGTLFGIPRVESKVIAAPVVMNTQAHGALYLSPLSLARFEENAGKTNTSLVRLEGHAAYGTERPAAAIRIAAS